MVESGPKLEIFILSLSLLYIYIIIWIADIITCPFPCHVKITVVPHQSWGSLRSQTLRQLMQNRGISYQYTVVPYQEWRFCTPLGKAKAKHDQISINYNNFVGYSYYILQNDVYIISYYDDKYPLRGYTIFFSKLRRMTWYGRTGRANSIDIVWSHYCNPSKGALP